MNNSDKDADKDDEGSWAMVDAIINSQKDIKVDDIEKERSRQKVRSLTRDEFH